jgi:hypothetical protein
MCTVYFDTPNPTDFAQQCADTIEDENADDE